MKYLLVEPKVKAIAPNIALLKWARWCSNNGHEYKYIRGCVDIDFVPDRILMSCIFSYYSKTYEKTIKWYLNKYSKAEICIGGVFPTLNEEWFSRFYANMFFSSRVQIHKGITDEIENLPPKYDIEIISEDAGKRSMYKVNKIVTYASRGCINKCQYCAVPTLEGNMHSFESIQDILNAGRKELPNASSVVLYDNNFNAHKYFDNIVDELIKFGLPVDIHGLHVSSFTEHQAERFAELKWSAQSDKGTAYMRFSFDWVKYYKHIDRAVSFVVDKNIKAGFFCYMLFNWNDSPHDFWKRIVMTQDIVDRYGRTIFLFPQRFEPFMALERNKYVGEKWDNDLVRGITKMYTWIHGFLSVTKSRNLFNWIGHTEEEFFDRARKMVTNRNYKLEKITGRDLPTTKMLLESI